MTEAEWAELFGPFAIYRASWGIPSLWREAHLAGRPLGPALGEERTIGGIPTQHFALGLIRWTGPRHGVQYYAPSAAGPRTDPQPRPDLQLRPAPGYSPFYHDVTVAWDSTGALFWNAQCEGGRGLMVFRQTVTGTTVALNTGKDGRGALFVQNGWLYLVAMTTKEHPSGRSGTVLPVPEWRP